MKVRYGVAIFLSSGLLFLIEPIAAKRLLPLLGGGAAVWTACLMFFQFTLLLGYGLAHLLVTRVPPRRQAEIYLGLVLLSLAQLGLAVNQHLHASPARPVTSVVVLLAKVIGLPFLTLSATSPLLQAWYARESDGGAAYQLYSVSNVGSLLALVLYPLALEPRLSLRQQSATLALGFAAYAVVSMAIVMAVRKLDAIPTVANTSSPRSPVRGPEIGLWIALSACGSLLLSAVTTFISQNIASIPLLWIAPLIAYLLSFVVAFSGERWLPREAIVVLGVLGLGGASYFVSKGIFSTPLLVLASGFCVSLFFICLFLHAELYLRRPPEAQLTTFYFCLASGGALGATLVGVVAPSVLDGNYELVIGLTLAGVLALITTWDFGPLVRIIAVVGTAGMATLIVSEVRSDRVNALTRVRNFYGTLYVTEVHDPDYNAIARTLYNGPIKHGQELYREDLAHIPSTYYGRESGLGYAMDLCCEGRPRRIGVIGLGAGTVAAYGKPGDVIRFYDINPAVEGIARHQFHYVSGSPASVDIVIGDARVSLEGEPPQRYDVIVIDAFSGDAIPVHLITLEALQMYKRHLAPGGIVAFHVSNRYLYLQPVVAQLAERAGMSIAHIANAEDDATNVWPSDWVLVTNNRAFLDRPEVAKVTQEVTIPPTLRLWTDDYNSLVPVFKFGR